MNLSSSAVLMGMMVCYTRTHGPLIFTVSRLREFLSEEAEIRPEIRRIFDAYIGEAEDRGSLTDLRFLMERGMVSLLPSDGPNASPEQVFLLDPAVVRSKEDELRQSGVYAEHQNLFEGLANALAEFIARPAAI